MILFVVAIRDRAAQVYGQPNFVTSIGGAIRGFADEINRPADNNMLSKHPEDFDMFHLGSYNDEIGEFQCGTPKQIAIGKDLVIKK